MEQQTVIGELTKMLIRQVMMSSMSLQHPTKTVNELTELVEAHEAAWNDATTLKKKLHPYVAAWADAALYVDQVMRAIEYTGHEVIPQQASRVESPYRIVTDFAWGYYEPEVAAVPVGWIRYLVIWEAVCGYCGETVGMVQRKRSQPQPKNPQPDELAGIIRHVSKHLVECPLFDEQSSPKGVIKMTGFGDV